MLILSLPISTFSAPCQPAHDTNITINGFDSGFRPTDNGTDITILSVPIDDSNVNTPFWFYDASPGACGSGAVGVINSNESSTATLAGFVVRIWLLRDLDLRFIFEACSSEHDIIYDPRDSGLILPFPSATCSLHQLPSFLFLQL